MYDAALDHFYVMWQLFPEPPPLAALHELQWFVTPFFILSSLILSCPSFSPLLSTGSMVLPLPSHHLWLLCRQSGSLCSTSRTKYPAYTSVLVSSSKQTALFSLWALCLLLRASCCVEQRCEGQHWLLSTIFLVVGIWDRKHCYCLKEVPLLPLWIRLCLMYSEKKKSPQCREPFCLSGQGRDSVLHWPPPHTITLTFREMLLCLWLGICSMFPTATIRPCTTFSWISSSATSTDSLANMLQ